MEDITSTNSNETIPQNGTESITPEEVDTKKRKNSEKEESSDDKGNSNNNSDDGEKDSKKHRVKKERGVFVHGNYDRYYGYRQDFNERLRTLNKKYFINKKCLDIGCNSGKITFEIGKRYKPKQIVGIDIDSSLITKANDSLNAKKKNTPIPVIPKDFPISFAMINGPLDPIFPHNVSFIAGNYIESQNQEKFDTIICLSVTKWIHLNSGDEGVKTLFKKVYESLNDKGVFILEPQQFKTYRKKSDLTQEIKNNYKNISFKPDQFCKYLTEELKFKQLESLQVKSENSAKSFKERPIYIFSK